MAWARVNVKWDGAAGKEHAKVKMDHLVAISNDTLCKNSNNEKKRKEVTLETKPLTKISLISPITICLRQANFPLLL